MRGNVPFFEALNQADAISVHCPLNENTRGMIGAKEIQKMKSGAILLNLGRGGLIDESALVKALISGKLSGAGLDVLSSEPPRKGSPLLNNIPNLLLTPHIAWSSEESLSRLYVGLQENINSFVKGRPLNQVNE